MSDGIVDLTKPVRQVENKEVVRVLCMDGKRKNFPVIVEWKDGSVENYTRESRYYLTLESGHDLENIPEKPKPTKTLWVMKNELGQFDLDYVVSSESTPGCPERWVKFQEVRE